MPRNKIAGSYRSFYWNFFQKNFRVLYSGCSDFHSHHRAQDFSFLTSLQHVFIFFIMVILTDNEVMIHLVLICMLLINDVSIANLYMFCWENVLSDLLSILKNSIFKNWGAYSIESYFLYVWPLIRHIIFKFFLLHCRLPFILWMTFFAVQNLLSLL